MPVAASRARRDITQQQIHDGDWGDGQTILQARMAAVLGAQEALAAREPGAEPAFRQSLVDLAAVAEVLADELPAPTVDGRSGSG